MSKRLRPIEALAQGRIFACLTLRSSWRRLPPELWDNIFSYFLAATRIEQTVGVEPRVLSTASLHGCANLTTLTLIGRIFRLSALFWINAVLHSCPLLRHLVAVGPKDGLESLLLPLTQTGDKAKAQHLETLTIAYFDTNYMEQVLAPGYGEEAHTKSIWNRSASSDTFPFAPIDSFIASRMPPTSGAGKQPATFRGLALHFIKPHRYRYKLQ
ncbi:hypothetical protein NMY22_g18433 [Coprinellus aureogranulatus]|nr:hypothetical protein NMY22_g18433 [Coprinellus aureogranulatus]